MNESVVRCPFAILTQQPLLDNLSFGIEERAGQAWQLFPPLFGFIASDRTRIVKLSKHIFVLHVLLVFLSFFLLLRGNRKRIKHPHLRPHGESDFKIVLIE